MPLFGLSKSDVKKMAAKRDVKSLIKALAYKKDAVVRSAAAEALGEMGDSRAVDGLIAALKDQEWNVRWDAAIALEKIGDSRAMDALVVALKDQNALVRRCAAIALEKIGDARAVDALVIALKDENSDVRCRAGDALVKILGKLTLEELVVALKHQDAAVRSIAAGALGNIGDARAADGLVVALKDPDSDLRKRAVRALGKIGDARASDGLVVALKDENTSVRSSAALVLGKRGDARAVDGLVVALNDPDLDVRLDAVEALGKLRQHPRAVDGLVIASKDQNEKVRFAAKVWLRGGVIDEDLAVDSLVLTLKNEGTYLRRQAAVALGKIGDARAVDALTAACKDPDWEVRQSAAEALVKIGGEHRVDKLVVATNVDNELANTNKGIAFLRLSQYSEAIKCFDESLEINPNNGDVWLYKGLALGGLGQFAETVKCCDKALEINPNNLRALTVKRRATMEATTQKVTMQTAMASIPFDIVSELQLLKQKISALPQKYSTGSAGPNVIGVAGPSVNLRERPAQAQIPTICAVIDDAIKALDQGLDIKNKPITRPEIAGALKRLAADTRRPEFVFLVSTVLNQTGLSELEKCMGELEQIASKII